VFIALAAIGWADGNLDPEEARTIVGAAQSEGLDPESLRWIEQATRQPVTLEQFLGASAMGKDDRLFVYAMACWIARVDGEVTQREVATLQHLASLLGVSERLRRSAEGLVQEIAASGTRVARYDLGWMRQVITDRLIEPEHQRDAGG
jgi:uncharacterized membrane protein YebE (DUF533 family)